MQSMANKKETIQSIIRSLDNLETMSHEEYAAENEFPQLIPSGDGGNLLVDAPTLADIRKLANILYCDYKDNFTRKEWCTTVRDIIGHCYIQTNSTDTIEKRRYEFGGELKRKLKIGVSRHSNYFVSFGCSLFNEPLDTELIIGPVVFSTLHVWLENALDRNLIEKSTYKS